MGSSVILITKDELTTGNYFNADNLIGGENTTIVKDGNVYKINTTGGEATTIESSDRSITVTTTTTGYDLTLDNGRWQKALWWYHESSDYPYTVDIASNYVKLRAGDDTVGMIYEHSSIDLSNSDIIMKFGGDDASGAKFNLLSTTAVYPGGPVIFIGDPAVTAYINSVVYDKNNNEIFGLTPDNAGDNITITGSGSTLKINATGGAGEKGDPGDSAYEIAVKHGYTGTEDEWLASLKGAKGDSGEKGDPGEKGDKGDPGSYEHITDNTNVVISNSSTADTFEFTADTISTLNEIVTTGEILTPGDGISITDKVVSIKSGGVTAAMLAPDAITSDNIPTGAITNDKIANNSITVDKLSVPSIVIEETNSSITDSYHRPVKLTCQKYNNVVEEDGVAYNKYIFKRIYRCFDNTYINIRCTRVYVY